MTARWRGDSDKCARAVSGDLCRQRYLLTVDRAMYVCCFEMKQLKRD